MSAEVDDLVRALRSDGVLTRERLRERSGALQWPDHSFNYALRRGVAEGSIRQLSDELFEAGEDAPDLDEARFNPP